MHVELVKEFRFESAHRLPRVPAEHKCFRMHGHSFRVEVAVAGEVDPELGWLVDFGEIAARVEPVLRQELDHRVLNDVPGLENPTSEVLAAWLWNRLGALVPHLAAITVQDLHRALHLPRPLTAAACLASQVPWTRPRPKVVRNLTVLAEYVRHPERCTE